MGKTLRKSLLANCNENSKLFSATGTVYCNFSSAALKGCISSEKKFLTSFKAPKSSIFRSSFPTHSEHPADLLATEIDLLGDFLLEILLFLWLFVDSRRADCDYYLTSNSEQNVH